MQKCEISIILVPLLILFNNGESEIQNIRKRASQRQGAVAH